MRRFRRRDDSAKALATEGAPVFVLLGAYLLYFIRFGYDYANSDQDEVIPYLLHRLDASLFTQDWFVRTQVSEFSVRTYFVWLLNTLSVLLPVWLVTLLVYLTAWFLIAAALYKLAYYFTTDRLAAAASVVVILVLTPVWTLGGNDLAHSMLVASMLAWALGLWAVYHFLRGRYILSPVLLGAACCIQALVGLQLAIILVLYRFISYLRNEPGHTFVGIFVFGGLFTLWASPAIGPILYEQFTSTYSAPAGAPSLFYMLAEFRLPHHYLPGSFYLHSYARFGALVVLGVLALSAYRFRRTIRSVDFVVLSLIIMGVLCGIAFIFSEVVPVLFIVKLQLFKTTVFAKLLLVIVIIGALCRWLPDRLRAPAESLLERSGWATVVTASALVIVGAIAVYGDGYLHNKVRPLVRAESSLGDLHTWARRQTSHEAIFAVPPSFSSFRSSAERTIVINFKAIPYQDDEMAIWFERLTTMAPIPLPERGGPELQVHLDRAYESLNAADLADRARLYNFDYVVRSTPLDSPLEPFREVFRAGEWIVYELPEPSEEEAEEPTESDESEQDGAMQESSVPGAAREPTTSERTTWG